MPANQPYVPTFFDQFQSAFGVDNPRTRQLAALRAGGAAQIAQQPVQAPAQPVGGVPGGGATAPGGFQQYLQQLQQQFQNLNKQYNTGNRIDAAVDQALPTATPDTAAALRKIGQ